MLGVGKEESLVNKVFEKFNLVFGTTDIIWMDSLYGQLKWVSKLNAKRLPSRIGRDNANFWTGDYTFIGWTQRSTKKEWHRFDVFSEHPKHDHWLAE